MTGYLAKGNVTSGKVNGVMGRTACELGSCDQSVILLTRICTHARIKQARAIRHVHKQGKYDHTHVSSHARAHTHTLWRLQQTHLGHLGLYAAGFQRMDRL